MANNYALAKLGIPDNDNGEWARQELMNKRGQLAAVQAAERLLTNAQHAADRQNRIDQTRPVSQFVRGMADVGRQVVNEGRRMSDVRRLSADELAGAGLTRVTKVAPGVYTSDAGAKGEQRLYDVSGRRVDRADPLGRVKGAHASPKAYHAAFANAPEQNGMVAMAMGRNALRRFGNAEQQAAADEAMSRMYRRAGVERQMTPEEMIAQNEQAARLADSQYKAASAQDKNRLRHLETLDQIDSKLLARQKEMIEAGLSPTDASVAAARAARAYGFDPNTLPSQQAQNASMSARMRRRAEQNARGSFMGAGRFVNNTEFPLLDPAQVNLDNVRDKRFSETLAGWRGRLMPGLSNLIGDGHDAMWREADAVLEIPNSDGVMVPVPVTRDDIARIRAMQDERPRR